MRNYYKLNSLDCSDSHNEGQRIIFRLIE